MQLRGRLAVVCVSASLTQSSHLVQLNELSWWEMLPQTTIRASWLIRIQQLHGNLDMRAFWLLARLVVASLLVAYPCQAEDREVRGRVVDAGGKPVAGVTVSQFWSANGEIDYSKKPSEKELQKRWARIGVMRGSYEPVVTDAAGRFAVQTLSIAHHVMAIDGERNRGGLAILPKGRESEPVEIRLGPLTKVRGALRGENDYKPDWTFVYLSIAGDSERPLDFPRLASCGSSDARFEFLLPPGNYTLYGYDREFQTETSNVPKLVLDGERAELDLGTLELKPSHSVIHLRNEARAEGRWLPLEEQYGRPCPDWHATDARGVDKDAKPADFRGKWLLIEFWGLNCTPCLRTSLPKLTKFYEEHAHQRDQFAVVTICMDPEGDLKSIAEMDKALEPIVEHVWNGKPFALPVLVDPTFTTWERFGLRGMGDLVLVNPEGTLVEGDLQTLAEKLK